MILLVPMSFGFTYMMIKLANEAERKSKLARSSGPKKVATLSLSEKWINWLLVALLAFQVFLNIAAYNAAITGMNNMSLFFVGMILLVFAGFFHIYRYGISEQKNAPPPPPKPVQDEKLGLAEPGSSLALEDKDAGAKADAKEKPKEIAPTIPIPKAQASTETGPQGRQAPSRPQTEARTGSNIDELEGPRK